jgi:hypothetical protein
MPFVLTTASLLCIDPSVSWPTDPICCAHSKRERCISHVFVCRPSALGIGLSSAFCDVWVWIPILVSVRTKAQHRT